MISLTFGQVEDVMLLFKEDIEKYNKLLVPKLRQLLIDFPNAEEANYTTYLISIADKIIKARPKQLGEYKTQFDIHIPPDILVENHVEYRNRILAILDYKGRRKDFYPKYFRKLEIKACVYCNSQSALTVEREEQPGVAKGTLRSKFQVDHYLSKDTNPALSISLFNLYPVCANCNNIKGIKNVLFELYTEQYSKKSKFRFYLANGSQANYLLSRKLDDLQICFEQPQTIAGNEDYNLLFDIKSIYNEHKDVVEELILKAEIYTPAYKKTLKNNFLDIFLTDEMLDRLIIGNYPEEKDIHKRSLAKFMKDISLDIGLIKIE